MRTISAPVKARAGQTTIPWDMVESPERKQAEEVETRSKLENNSFDGKLEAAHLPCLLDTRTDKRLGFKV